MAQFTNTFAPMQNAIKNYQETMSEIPKIRYYQSLNKLRNLRGQYYRARTKSEQAEFNQRRNIQQEVFSNSQTSQQQGFQTHPSSSSQELQTQPNSANALRIALGPTAFQDVTGVIEPQQKQNRTSPQTQEVQTKPLTMRYIEAYRKYDPEKASELMGELIRQTMNLAEGNKSRAEKYWFDNTGERIKIKGKDKNGNWVIKSTEHGLMRINEDTGTRSLMKYRGEPIMTDAKAKETKRLAKRLNISEELATKLTYGLIKMDTNEMGYSTMIDTTTMKRIPVKTQEKIKSELTGEKEKPFIDVDMTKKATGPVAMAKQAVNNLFGWAWPGQIFGKTEKSRSRVRMFNHSVMQAFAVNPRVPMTEQKQIKQFLVNPNRFAQDPDGSAQQYKNMYLFIQKQIQQRQGKIKDGDLPAKQMEEYKSVINTYDNILAIMENPKEITQKTFTNDQLQSMSISELKQISYDTFQSLPEQQQEIILNRE